MSGAGAVLVLNTSTDNVTARIELASGADLRDAVFANGRLWVTDFANDVVYVVNPTDRRVVDTIAVGQSPIGIDAHNGTVAVADWNGTNSAFGALTLIATTGRAVTDTIQIPSTTDGGPRSVSICDSFAFVTNDGRDRLYEINLSTGSVNSIADGELPHGVDCADGSLRVAFANRGADIQMRERRFKHVRTFTSSDGTERVSWTRFLAGNVSKESVRTDEGTITRTRIGGGSVTLSYVHENGTTERTRTVNLGVGARYGPFSVDLTPDGESLFVTDRNADMVFQVNWTTGEIEDTFHTGPAPMGSVVANGKLYVANSGTHQISTKGEPFDYGAVSGPGSITVHDPTTGQPNKTILAFANEAKAPPTGTFDIKKTSAPRLLTADPTRSTVFAPLSGTGDVLALDTATGNQTLINLPGATDARSAVTVGDELWVASFGNGSIHIVDTDTKKVTDTIAACQNPWQIDEENGTVIVACWSGTANSTGAVVFIDATTHDIVDTITPMSTNDGGPWGVSSCEDFVYVTNDGTDDTFQVDLDTLEVTLIASGELPWEVNCAEGVGSHTVIPANGGADIPMSRVDVEHRIVTDNTVWWNITTEGAVEKENVTLDGTPWIVQETFNLDNISTIAFALDVALNVSNDNGTIDKVEFDRAIDLWDAGEPVPGTDGLMLTSARLSKLEEMLVSDVVVDQTRRERWGDASAFFVPVEADGTVQLKEKEHINVGVGARYEPWGVGVSPDGTTSYITDMHINVVYEASTTTGRFSRAFHTGPAPRDAIEAATGKLYVANSGTHQISSKDGTAKRFDYTKTVLGPGSIGVINVTTGTTEKAVVAVQGNPTIQNPANFTYSNLTVSPTEALTNETVTIYAEVENTGDLAGTFNATFVVDGEVVDYQTGTLNGSESTQVTFRTAFAEPGTHEVFIDGLPSQEIQVESCINREVAGGDRLISLTEIQTAINWWAEDTEVPNTGNETISLTKIQSLINAWAENKAISCTS